MSEQPEALRLANRMALIGASMDGDADRAAAELRRLYALCKEMGKELEAGVQIVDYYQQKIRRLHALCEESRTAVRGLLNALPSATTHPAIIAARALVAKLENEQ